MSDLPVETKAAKTFDPEVFSLNLARAMESGGRALAAYLKPRQALDPNDRPPSEVAEVIKTFGVVAQYWMSDQTRATDVQMKLGKAYLELWGSAMRRMAGDDAPRTIEPAPRDKRFADPEWKSNQFFEFVMQAYLLTTKWAFDLVREAENLDPHTRKKAE
ncbi:MAG: class I poly(R)-hydroxyalkanoic acid synthase, partial [Rhizobiales bacterium]|nr:class I poly(R)-hydroxyalkanoic acid synthase [Hyphomicrobiales bacterium]